LRMGGSGTVSYTVPNPRRFSVGETNSQDLPVGEVAPVVNGCATIASQTPSLTLIARRFSPPRHGVRPVCTQKEKNGSAR
jgi:hypothetical protein